MLKFFNWIPIGLLLCCNLPMAISQPDTIVIGFGSYEGVQIASSSNVEPGDPENTLNQNGFLPNDNAASRFLSQATLGYNLNDIDDVKSMGIEDWIDNQLSLPKSFNLLDKVIEYRDTARIKTNDPNLNSSNRMWDYSFWQYLMTSDDALRQRVALALSEIIVISEKSSFGNRGISLSRYYDILLDHSFGNYRDLLQDVTYNPSMGVYLTYMNNPKTDTTINRFPDENYAREVMQLFTIGTSLLNNDGTEILDSLGSPIATYDNDDISEFSKVFTGLTLADRTQFGKGAHDDTSYIANMVMWESFHEPGVKNLLNGFQIPDRNPIDGDADISDALDNLFNHPNTPPFVCKLLIQRLVTANPEPDYVNRVANVFIDNGAGVRGDLAAVTKAILMDPIAQSCDSGKELDFGSLREPFIRYVQINKAFNASTLSGNYRNEMRYIYDYTDQRPLSSPSVFNFFQQDYQPIGPIEDADKFAPVFQITDAQTIAGYINGLYRWLISGDIADEYDIYSGEPNSDYENEISQIDLLTEMDLTDHDELHVLMDRLNLLLAQGRVSEESINIIIDALKEFPNSDAEDKEDLVRLAIYLFMTSPEYLINR